MQPRSSLFPLQFVPSFWSGGPPPWSTGFCISPKSFLSNFLGV